MALKRTVIAAYAAPAFSQALIHGPTGSVIQGIYAKQFGLSLQSIAFVLLIASIFDAVINPTVGYLSDRHHRRSGTRKPWIIGGSLLAMIASWFLYAPEPPITTAYFMFWLLLAFASWAITEVPYGAWMAEITDDYDDRTRLATWRGVNMYLGTIVFFALPFLPFLPTTEFTAESLRWTAIVALIVLPLFAFAAVTVVPNGPHLKRKDTRVDLWRGLTRNRPLMLFVALLFLFHLASGFTTGLFFFYVDGYLRQGPYLAGLFLIALPIGALAMPVWGALCRRFGKHRAWAAGSAGGALAVLLYAVVPPGSPNLVLLAAIHVLVIACFASFAVAAPAMLADVVDYGRWRLGTDYAGTYFSLYNVTYKALPGLGAATGLAVAGWFGFDPQLTEQTASGRFGLLFAFSGISALLLAAAVPLMWWFPIDARRQRIIARRLEQRRARSAP